MGKENIKRKGVFTPVISGGSLGIDDLKNLISQMEEEGAKVVKFGGEVTFVWDAEKLPDGVEERADYKRINFREGGVRPVRMCSAEIFCERYNRPVLGLAKRIDRTFGGAKLGSKLTIGVAGCQRSCSEPSVKDIGIIGTPKGFDLLVGGAGGMRPMIGKKIASVETEDDVIRFIEKTIEFMREFGDETTRLGLILEREGEKKFRDFLVG